MYAHKYYLNRRGRLIRIQISCGTSSIREMPYCKLLTWINLVIKPLEWRLVESYYQICFSGPRFCFPYLCFPIEMRDSVVEESANKPFYQPPIIFTVQLRR